MLRGGEGEGEAKACVSRAALIGSKRAEAEGLAGSPAAFSLSLPIPYSLHCSPSAFSLSLSLSIPTSLHCSPSACLASCISSIMVTHGEREERDRRGERKRERGKGMREIEGGREREKERNKQQAR